MDEEEINLWFEEKKEDLIKSYLKHMDSLMIEEDSEESKKKEKQKLSTEEIKKLMLVYEKNFIADSEKLRKKYDALIQKSRRKEKKKQNKKENRQKIIKFFSPLTNFIKQDFERSKEILHIIFRGWKNFRITIFSPFIKRNSQSISMKIDNKARPIRFFYRMHIWPTLHYLNGPNRKLKIKLVKLKEKTKEILKKIISLLKDKTVKAIKKIIEIIKKFFGSIGKIVKKIAEIFQKMIAFMKKFVLYVKSRLPHKSDD